MRSEHTRVMSIQVKPKFPPAPTSILMLALAQDAKLLDQVVGVNAPVLERKIAQYCP